MKPRLIPLYFPGRDADFDRQTARLKALLAGEAELLEPIPLGAPLPEAEAAVFPQMLGDAYRMVEAIRAIPLPRLVITSEFGTVSMWDWEIRKYLKSEGIETIAPYNLQQTLTLCRALGAKKELSQSKFLVYQDNPGQGFQAEIFKRFYWWEDECVGRMRGKFGLAVVKKSFKELGAAAKEISDQEAEAAWQEWRARLPIGDISPRALYSALKIYIAVKRELDQDDSILSVGINCLNESHFSDTTPCLAWNMLFEERRMVWGCEGDLVSMLTMYLLNRPLDAPVMMTNLYPFLMGQAATKHERIPGFPIVQEPENCILTAHCGFFGIVARPHATEWTLRKKVLAIVDENATAIDARFPEGDVTLVKIEPTFESLSVVPGRLEGYVQFPGSDCLNGGLIRVADGRRLVEELASHHYILATGHHSDEIDMVCKVFGLKVEQ